MIYFIGVRLCIPQHIPSFPPIPETIINLWTEQTKKKSCVIFKQNDMMKNHVYEIMEGEDKLGDSEL